MAKRKVLITVKTYPTLSEKYVELVCTAGFLEDGSWIRLYPVPFRKLADNSQYKKWDWIEIDVDKNLKDFRKESYRPKNIDLPIKCVGHIDHKHWNERKSIVLRNVYTNMDALITKAKDKENGPSLAVFKPKKIIDFVYEPCERDWDENKIQIVNDQMRQLNLFESLEDACQVFKLVKKIPYKFSYKFISDDGKERKLMIEDWELGALYWNTLKKYKNEDIACQKVREKYFDEFVNKRDLYFFLGTTWKFHNIGAPNPFIIIGTFYPPKTNNNNSQLELNFED